MRVPALRIVLRLLRPVPVRCRRWLMRVPALRIAPPPPPLRPAPAKPRPGALRAAGLPHPARPHPVRTAVADVFPQASRATVAPIRGGAGPLTRGPRVRQAPGRVVGTRLPAAPRALVVRATAAPVRPRRVDPLARSTRTGARPSRPFHAQPRPVAALWATRAGAPATVIRTPHPRARAVRCRPPPHTDARTADRGSRTPDRLFRLARPRRQPGRRTAHPVSTRFPRRDRPVGRTRTRLAPTRSGHRSRSTVGRSCHRSACPRTRRVPSTPVRCPTEADRSQPRRTPRHRPPV